MIKNDKDYKKRRAVEDKPIELLTDTPFEDGKRKGVLSFEDEIIIFREMITAQRVRSRQIARTKHFSVLERPDGDITGTFRFKKEGRKLRGQLSAEFWQAISLALELKEKEHE